MKKLIVIAILLMFVVPVMAGDINTDGIKITLFDNITIGNDNKIILEVNGYDSCYDTVSNYCRITIKYPDGTQRILVWSPKDAPIKIIMEGIEIEDYVEELEKRIDELETQEDFILLPYYQENILLQGVEE